MDSGQLYGSYEVPDIIGYSRHLEELLVYQFQGIDTLLEFEVLIRELGFVFCLPQLLLDHLLRACSERREVRTTQ